MQNLKVILMSIIISLSIIYCNNDSEIEYRLEYIGDLKLMEPIIKKSFVIIENKIYFNDLSIEDLDKVKNNDEIILLEGLSAKPRFYFNKEKYFIECGKLIKKNNDQEIIIGAFEHKYHQLYIGDILITNDYVFIEAVDSGLDVPTTDDYQHVISSQKIYRLDKKGNFKIVWVFNEDAIDQWVELQFIKYNSKKKKLMYSINYSNKIYSQKLNSENESELLDSSFAYSGSIKDRRIIDIMFYRDQVLTFACYEEDYSNNKFFEIWKFNGTNKGHECVLQTDQLYWADLIFEYKNEIYVIENLWEDYEYSHTEINRLKLY